MVFRKRNKKITKEKAPVVVSDEGEILEIPFEGSLGLLAAGYKGIILWRQKRKEILQNRKKNKDNGQ